MSDNLPAKVSESLFSKEVEGDEEAMWDFLPPEILPNILLRLPTKSIVKFTCVCKTWRSLIRNPDFISAQTAAWIVKKKTTMKMKSTNCIVTTKISMNMPGLTSLLIL